MEGQEAKADRQLIAARLGRAPVASGGNSRNFSALVDAIEEQLERYGDNVNRLEELIDRAAGSQPACEQEGNPVPLVSIRDRLEHRLTVLVALNSRFEGELGRLDGVL